MPIIKNFLWKKGEDPMVNKKSKAIIDEFGIITPFNYDKEKTTFQYYNNIKLKINSIEINK